MDTTHTPAFKSLYDRSSQGFYNTSGMVSFIPADPLGGMTNFTAKEMMVESELKLRDQIR